MNRTRQQLRSHREKEVLQLITYEIVKTLKVRSFLRDVVCHCRSLLLVKKIVPFCLVFLFLCASSLLQAGAADGVFVEGACPCSAISKALTGCDDTCVPNSLICETFQNNCNPNARSNEIERLFKPPNESRASKKVFADDCVFPDIEISIEKADMLTLLALGTKRILLQNNEDITMMDVGMISEDTQFWAMPLIDFNSATLSESVLPSVSPFSAEFTQANIVYETTTDQSNAKAYSHYWVNDDDVTLLGLGIQNSQDTFSYASFETEVDFPVQCGTTVMSESNIQLGYNEEVDYIEETKNLVVRSTGFLTPINEPPVKALLSYHDFTSKSFFNGVAMDSVAYGVFTWFSVEGHRITGILKPGSPIEGVAEFINIKYERTILECPPSQDLGLDLLAATYKAQNEITSSGAMLNGPIQFIANSAINLKPGFRTSYEFEALIVADPCIEE